jgi:hypothetical protein
MLNVSMFLTTCQKHSVLSSRGVDYKCCAHTWLQVVFEDLLSRDPHRLEVGGVYVCVTPAWQVPQARCQDQHALTPYDGMLHLWQLSMLAA